MRGGGRKRERGKKRVKKGERDKRERNNIQ
jgi:hypothetical protein